MATAEAGRLKIDVVAYPSLAMMGERAFMRSPYTARTFKSQLFTSHPDAPVTFPDSMRVLSATSTERHAPGRCSARRSASIPAWTIKEGETVYRAE
jgi:hypothetical protein